MYLKKKLLTQLLVGIALSVLLVAGIPMVFCGAQANLPWVMLCGIIFVSFGIYAGPALLVSALTNWWKIKLIELIVSGVSTLTALSAGVKKSQSRVINGIHFLIRYGYLVGVKIENGAVVVTDEKLNN